MSKNLALGKDFLSCYARLPSAIQNKVRSFMEGFPDNLSSSAVHLEPVREFRDPKLKTLRIDQTYRAVVLEQGTIYTMLWIDHHDKAYAWGRNKEYGRNEETGQLQYIDIDTADPSYTADDAEQAPPQQAGLFSPYRDRELKRIGVPTAIIPFVRSIADPADLDQKAHSLDPSVKEALEFLAAGISIEEIERELLVPDESEVDRFDSGVNGRHFTVITDDAQLQRVLTYPLEQWRVYLHPSQQQLVDRSFSGPARVMGSAGTGKTVILLHRAQRLASALAKAGSGKRVLFLTFNKFLVAYVKQQLEKLCSRDEMERIEVINLDAWASRFLKTAKIAPVDSRDFKPLNDNQKRAELFERALAYDTLGKSLEFYLNEYERVLLDRGIRTRSQYFKASRSGLGTPLQRRERAAAWPVFEEYERSVDKLHTMEFQRVITTAAEHLQSSGTLLSYAHILVDEAQDFANNAFALIGQILQSSEIAQKPDNLFIAGDSQQRIYGRQVVLSQVGIDIRGRSRILRINYRTTEEIASRAIACIDGESFDDLDGTTLERLAVVSLLHGQQPSLNSFESFKDETDFLAQTIAGLIEAGEPATAICLVVRSRDTLSRYQSALEAKGMDLKRKSDEQHPGPYIETMHGVKGLEFDHVFIAALDQNTIPKPSTIQNAPSAIDQKRLVQGERSLLYVAMTRARKSLGLSYWGQKSELL